MLFDRSSEALICSHAFGEQSGLTMLPPLGTPFRARDLDAKLERFLPIKPPPPLGGRSGRFGGCTVVPPDGQQIEKDSDRDRWFTAQEALDYGFVDHVVSKAAMTDSTNPVTDN